MLARASGTKTARRKTKSPRNTSIDPATAYALSVVSGEHIEGPHVRAACKRHLDDLENGPKRGLRWNIEAAQHALDFFPDVLTVEQDGEVVPFQLLPEWEFVIGCIFGWQYRNGDKWYRRFNQAYIEAGKGSAKTPLAAGVGMYMLTADKELSAEVYAAAGKKDQAMRLFNDAVAMYDRSPPLKERLHATGKTRVSKLTHPPSRSTFEPISADKQKSGARVHCGLVDELHEHKDRYTVDMLKHGFKGRKQPLEFVITNSGFDRNSICWEWHQHAIMVADRTREDDRFFSFVMALDNQDDPLEDEACWEKTNPGIGITITRQYLENQVNDARMIPGRENEVLRLNFCRWCVTPDTLVTMADGSRKRADELRAGEIILAFDEETQALVKARVAAVKDNGEHPVFRITTSRGRTTRVTAEHRFWSRWGRTDGPVYGWKRAVELTEGDRLATALGHSLPKGGRYLNEEEARFLGLMAGDGTCNGTPRITNLDPDIIAWCARFAAKHGCRLAPLPDGFHWDFRHSERSNGRRKTQGLQTKIKTILKKHRMYGENQYTKRVPRMVEKGGPGAWSAFLSGYLDTDGDVGKTRIRWTSCNRALLVDCQHLLALLGLEAAVNEPRPGGFRLEIRDVRSLISAASILKPVHRKKAAAVEAFRTLSPTDGPASRDRQRFDRIVSIERQSAQPTVGIEVEGVHTHVTDGLITHNTDSDKGWMTRGTWEAIEEDLVEFQEGAAIAPDFAGAECYLGLDLSFAFDLSALAFLFPEGDKLVGWIEYFIARETAAEREKIDHQPYPLWLRQGLIHGTTGKVIRLEHIGARIAEAMEQFDVQWISYDKYRHKNLEDEMAELGLHAPWIEHPQGFRRAGQLPHPQFRGEDGKPMDNPLWMPQSVAQLEARVLERTLRIQRSLVTRNHVAAVVPRQNPAGTGDRVFDKAKAVGRIDGIVSLAMATGAAEMKLPKQSLAGFLNRPVMTK